MDAESIPGINASKLTLPRLSQQATPSNQCNALGPVQFLLIGSFDLSLHFPAFLPWALLLLQRLFSVRPFGKGVDRPRRESVSSRELTTLLEREETQQQQRFGCFPPKYQSSSSSRAGCWCRQGGQKEAQAAPAAGSRGGEWWRGHRPENAPLLLLLLPSTRFVPPVLAVSGLGRVKSTVSFLGETMHQ